MTTSLDVIINTDIISNIISCRSDDPRTTFRLDMGDAASFSRTRWSLTHP